MNASLGERLGRNQVPLIQFHKTAHLMVQTVGENQALHLIIFLNAVVFPRGVEDPVAYVHQVQKIAELLFRQFNFHMRRPLFCFSAV